VSAFLILGGSAVVAIVLTLWLGGNAKRVVVIGACGVVAAAALVALSLVFAPESVEQANCHHCAEYLGRWVDPLALLFPAVLALAWLIGVGVGAGARATRR
jgi:hypothetical protein